MCNIDTVFKRIEKLTHEEAPGQFIRVLYNDPNTCEKSNETINNNTNYFHRRRIFLKKLYQEIDILATEIKNDNSILISVKNQKSLRTCFHLITSLGISSCLIPGLGISLSKRCLYADMLPPAVLSDEEKYQLLIDCTDFFTRCYTVPVLKNIIITFHLSDYLAALIQLSFAPLKKPGIYKDNFTMTLEMYERFNLDKQKYINVYEHLVVNCFQPNFMKELLVLQSTTDPSPPLFVKKVISKEMSRRLLVRGGLLSLIRCFIESYGIDTGLEWKKIDMICKIVSTKHGNISDDNYLNNICSQLMKILSHNNTHYISSAVACVLSLYEKFPQSDIVKKIVKEVYQPFDYQNLISVLPGTVILTPQEVEHKINVLHASVCMIKLNWPISLLTPNLYLLYLLGVKCSKSKELKTKLNDIILKYLDHSDKSEIYLLMKMFLFGNNTRNSFDIIVEEYEAGLCLKCISSAIKYPMSEALFHFLTLFNATTNQNTVEIIFEYSLKILMELTDKRHNKRNKGESLTDCNIPELLDNEDEQYANILQLLSEISTSPKVISSLKSNPSIVIDFIEHFVLKNYANPNEECVTIALILLNTVLSNSNKKILKKPFLDLLPVLKIMSEDDSSCNSILCKEAISLILSEKSEQSETACGKALANVFDDLLPVRAHGIIELTKLIDANDTEAVSKKHYIFCIFQEQLKDPDSYIYLSAINGMSALCTRCTDDVLQVLCREFLQVSAEQRELDTKDSQYKTAELRMKIGDIIVKVTKRLGEIAVVHKNILLNTMLCGCRDQDPLIRTSSLSNLAEIALVLHYRIGSIIYELLLCVWGIIETDKAIECRRAAVMVISSFLKGLGKDTLIQLKENILPIYRTLKSLYRNPDEDSVVKLHAQIALEELNDIVNQFMFPELQMEKQIFVLDQPINEFN